MYLPIKVPSRFNTLKFGKAVINSGTLFISSGPNELYASDRRARSEFENRSVSSCKVDNVARLLLRLISLGALLYFSNLSIVLSSMLQCQQNIAPLSFFCITQEIKRQI